MLVDRIDLPTGNGGYVEFVDEDDLTGGDLHALRKTMRQEDGGGEITNQFYRAAMIVAIKSWGVPYLAERDPRIPQANPAAWKHLKARDLAAIERALTPLWDLVRPPQTAELDDTPGSPTPPDGD